MIHYFNKLYICIQLSPKIYIHIPIRLSNIILRSFTVFII